MQPAKRHKASHPPQANGHAGGSADGETAASLRSAKQGLPIWKVKEQLLAELQKHCTLVLIGETGSGKTTQLPQFVLDAALAGGGAVACTQPRRVAAMSVAARVARERGCQLGKEVGYSIRFDDKSCAETRLKYLTDGMLVREALLDPQLRRYKVIILDEAHERTVQTDVLFSLVKAAQEKRRDSDPLRLVVMSATLDAAKFVHYFPGARAAFLQGRQHPVEVFYTAEPQQSYVDAALRTVAQLHAREPPGDVLLFLTGQDEIEGMARMLAERETQLQGPPGARRLQVVSIFAAQTPEQQMAVFRPAAPDHRKVILATNIAETSVTVPGVRYVIDPGFIKARAFQAREAVDVLAVVPVSQAQARQRAGRAGREAPGKAFRLFTEAAFGELAAAAPPEIQRARLTGVVLQLKALGVADPLAFDFMDAPPRAALLRALEQLYALGALDDSGALTRPLGLNLSRLPVEPTLGRVLLAAADGGCTEAALAVVAMVSSDAVHATSRSSREGQDAAAEQYKRFVHPTGDHMTLANILAAFLQVNEHKAQWCAQRLLNVRALRKACDIYKQLADYLRGVGLRAAAAPEAAAADWLAGDADGTALRRALTSGLFMNAALLQPDGSYRVVASGQGVHIHPASVLCGKRAKCIVFSELVATTKHYARQVSAVEPGWLAELAPAVFARARLPPPGRREERG